MLCGGAQVAQYTKPIGNLVESLSSKLAIAHAIAWITWVERSALKGERREESVR